MLLVEIAKCPKCGNELSEGVLNETRLLKEGDMLGDRVAALYCKNCGYIELYIEKLLWKDDV